jgi:Flp pilus assembly protein TadG
MTATSSMPRMIRRFGRDRRGVSAVEFAFIAPVSLVAGALANLRASCGSRNANSGSCANNILSATEMNNILAASSAIIAPYNAANLTMRVSCLSVDANKT